MRIAVFIYNRPHMYSGGQYHAFALGKAIAGQQHQVDFYWNHPPVFSAEFAGIPTAGYYFPDTPGTTAKPYDYVIIAPSGWYVPDFYERALELASKCKARIGLLNYESENWFNALAPTKDDHRVWDYWRRVLVFGGLVITTAKEGLQPAKAFYHSPDSPVTFETLQAPINSIVAAEVRAVNPAKNGSIVVFVRRQHDYKGAADLLKINPGVFAGRTLHIVFGGDVDQPLFDELERHYAGSGVQLRYHHRIPVEEKFRLLAQAQLLLFLSYFEGFGYPPVEAFAAGTAVVCYDLPVLRENLQHLPVYIPPGDIARLEMAITRTLSTAHDPSAWIARAEALSGFDKCGRKAVRILKANLALTRPVPDHESLLWWGPFSREQADAFPAPNLKLPYPIFVSQVSGNDSGALIEIKAIFAKPLSAVSVDTGILALQVQTITPSDAFPGWVPYTLVFQATSPGAGTITFEFNEGTCHRELFEIKPSDHFIRKTYDA